MILIGADIVPTESNIKLFENGEVEKLVGSELYSVLENADYKIMNLEVPMTDTKKPIIKYGPNLIAPSNSVNGLKALGIDLFILANNHIMDQGSGGLKSTIDVLERASISYVGAGKNLAHAAKPLFFTVHGKKYGIYACAEHEFSIAGPDAPGANPFNPLESLTHVSHMKDQCDFAIVLYHGGKEHYRYPSPQLQAVCRKIIENGADLVVCQHSHCIGCEELYQQGTIVYGQGNFLFDGLENEFWKTSLVISIDDNGIVDYIPLVKNGYSVRLARAEEKTDILKGFKRRSEQIKDPCFIVSEYASFAEMNLANYVMHLSGLDGNIIFRILNKLSGQKLKKSFINRYREQFGTAVSNYIECEAHRELLLESLKRKNNG